MLPIMQGTGRTVLRTTAARERGTRPHDYVGEAKAAAAEIVKATAGAGEQYDFSSWPGKFRTGAALLTSGAGVAGADQMRTFWEYLAEGIDAMPWQGSVPVKNGSPVVERDDATGKVICEPVKKIDIDGAANTNSVVRYAAAQAGIDASLLPWKLSIEIRPGRVRATRSGKLAADLTVSPASGTAPLSAKYAEHNDNSAAAVALQLIAERRQEAGDETGRKAAAMAAIGHFETVAETRTSRRAPHRRGASPRT